MRIVFAIFCIVLVAFVAVQYNDPDYYFWMPVYGVPAVLAAMPHCASFGLNIEALATRARSRSARLVVPGDRRSGAWMGDIQYQYFNGQFPRNHGSGRRRYQPQGLSVQHLPGVKGGA